MGKKIKMHIDDKLDIAAIIAGSLIIYYEHGFGTALAVLLIAIAVKSKKGN